MCTKYFADGDVHKYFNPYESPYDSYINFMNVLDNLRSRLPKEGAKPAPRKAADRTGPAASPAPAAKSPRKPRSQKSKTR